MNRRIESRRYLTYVEAREILQRRISESGASVNPVQERTWEFLRLFGQGDPTASRKAIEELMNAGLDEDLAVELVNMCPDDEGFINLILSGKKGLTISEELLNKIKETLSSVCRKETST
ncbi:MAG: hypothetical protein L7H09_01020 [Acidilobus sp.]|nr:hypothetical protein [Acidilobus sp.]MCG2873853.1 hypothetical protein [Acidilobus sp.]